MAKIAGRKNEGAWQRFNNWLANDMSPDEAAALEEAMEMQQGLSDYWTLISQTYSGYGIPLPAPLASLTTWCTQMVDNGFPLDVYMGKVSYDLYEEDPNNEGSYIPILAAQAGLAGTDVRALSKLYIFADRQLTWLSMDTHPAGGTLRGLKKKSPEYAAARAARSAAIVAAIEARKELRASSPLAIAPPMPKKKKLTK